MIRLSPMSDEAFEAYLSQAIEDYAQDKIQAGNWRASEARQKSAASYHESLPAGVNSENQYLFSIIAVESEADIGMIWFAVKDEQSQPVAFIYDFIIQEEFRRRGYGVQALRAIEDEVKGLGINTIALHVFGHNQGAIKLYKKMGYEITNINMKKMLNS